MNVNLFEQMPDLRGCYFLTPAGAIGRHEGAAFVIDRAATAALARPIGSFLEGWRRTRDTAAHRIAIVHPDHAGKPWQSHTLVFEEAVVRQLFPAAGAAVSEFQQRNREKSLYRGMELLLDYRHPAITELPYYCPVLVYLNTRLDRYRRWLARAPRPDDAGLPVVEVVNLFAELPLLDPAVDGYLQRLRAAVVRPERRSAANLYLMDEARPAPVRPAAARAPDPFAAMAPETVAELEGRLRAGGLRAWNYAEALARHCPGAAGRRFAALLGAAAGRHVGVETLRGFERMKDLDPTARQLISAAHPLLAAPAGTVLLDAGSSDLWNLYLVSGEVELIAADGQRSVVAAGSEAARRPLALLKPRRYTVVARRAVQFLWLYEPMVSAAARLTPGAARAGVA